MEGRANRARQKSGSAEGKAGGTGQRQGAQERPEEAKNQREPGENGKEPCGGTRREGRMGLQPGRAERKGQAEAPGRSGEEGGGVRDPELATDKYGPGGRKGPRRSRKLRGNGNAEVAVPGPTRKSREDPRREGGRGKGGQAGRARKEQVGKGRKGGSQQEGAGGRARRAGRKGGGKSRRAGREGPEREKGQTVEGACEGERRWEPETNGRKGRGRAGGTGERQRRD